MKKQISFVLLSGFFFLIGCVGENSTGDKPLGKLIEAQGGRYYGGVFRLNESEYIKNLFPLSIIDVYSYRVASQIYEGLLKFDQDSLNVINCLVNDYTVDSSRTVYTFNLKNNIFFHDDDCFSGGQGRKMTSHDVMYSFTMACTQNRNNQAFNLFDDIVKGAREYYDATKSGQKPDFTIEGFEVIDDFTFKVTLIEPNSMFLYNLARPGAFIFPKEAYDKYGADMRIKCVGTGPFKLSSVDEDISIILKKNNKYHASDQHGNRLPFFDAVTIQFIKDKKVELLEFRKGNLDMMYRLPTDYIIEVLQGFSSDPNDDENGYADYELQREPEMSTQCLLFFNVGEVFNDINVRKAFSFAIDREKILDFVLSGEGYLEGFHGITPPAFSPKYDIAQINGYRFDPDSAKYYLDKAGYPNGEGFPQINLDFNSEGERFNNVTVEIIKQLKDNLNIEVGYNLMTMASIAENAKSGNYNLMRLAWIADYPSPENYLWAFYSKTIPPTLEEGSYPNLTRYRNPDFDQYYEMGLAASNEDDAFEMFMKAEQALMNDAAILVLWYDEAYRLLQPYIKNFPNNPMQYRDLSTVYKIPTETHTE